MTAVIDARECQRVIDRMLMEYGEQPLRLTAAQAARLWQLETPFALALLEQLVAAGCLCCEGEQYVRASREQDRRH